MSKVRATFKSPDALDYALQDIQDEDERERAEEIFRQFVKYGEYVTIEINTETGEARVVPQG